MNKLFLLTLGIFVSLSSSAASNFWNHSNDVNEDKKNHKKTLLTENIIKQNEALLISVLLYILSILLVLYASFLLKRPIYIYYLIWVCITWWYSDSRFLIRITGIRLKTHYIGELLTYIIAYPAYTLSIWLIFSDSLTKGLILSLIFLCFGIAVVLLKDLKDVSGDRDAGLKTLGVIFSPSKLIKTACIFLILYFVIIIIATKIKIFDYYSFIVIIPLLYLIKNTTFHFIKKNGLLKWEMAITLKLWFYPYIHP